jgi:hypothetical protein
MSKNLHLSSVAMARLLKALLTLNIKKSVIGLVGA